MFRGSIGSMRDCSGYTSGFFKIMGALSRTDISHMAGAMGSTAWGVRLGVRGSVMGFRSERVGD